MQACICTCWNHTHASGCRADREARVDRMTIAHCWEQIRQKIAYRYPRVRLPRVCVWFCEWVGMERRTSRSMQKEGVGDSSKHKHASGGWECFILIVLCLCVCGCIAALVMLRLWCEMCTIKHKHSLVVESNSCVFSRFGIAVTQTIAFCVCAHRRCVIHILDPITANSYWILDPITANSYYEHFVSWTSVKWDHTHTDNWRCWD